MRELSSRLIEMLNARRLRLQQQHYQLQQQHNERLSAMRRVNTNTSSLGITNSSASGTQSPQQQLTAPPLPQTPPPPVSERAPTNNNSSSSSSSSSPQSQNRISFVKKRERNFLSAFCSIFCIAVLTVSLAETRWFYLNGGGCNVNYLGVSYFFVPGLMETRVEASKVSKFDINVYNFILPNGFSKFF
jgi:hypothetical protein